jgi:CheY-like chemotaxis protein
MMDGQRKVLIVDDDESSRDFVKAIMAAEGWEIVEAHNGAEGLDLAEEQKPGLIILDVSMPVMDGFEAFRRLRTEEATKHIPIIMLTAINELEPEAAHNEASMEKRFGVNRPEGFVDKPVDPVFLLNTVFGVVG